jgi:hypothetical protein
MLAAAAAHARNTPPRRTRAVRCPSARARVQRLGFRAGASGGDGPLCRAQQMQGVGRGIHLRHGRSACKECGGASICVASAPGKAPQGPAASAPRRRGVHARRFLRARSWASGGAGGRKILSLSSSAPVGAAVAARRVVAALAEAADKR